MVLFFFLSDSRVYTNSPSLPRASSPFLLRGAHLPSLRRPPRERPVTSLRAMRSPDEYSPSSGQQFFFFLLRRLLTLEVDSPFTRSGASDENALFNFFHSPARSGRVSLLLQSFWLERLPDCLFPKKIPFFRGPRDSFPNETVSVTYPFSTVSSVF